MKPNAFLAALFWTLLLPGLVRGTFADDPAEQPEPIPLPAAQPQLLAAIPAGVRQGSSAELTIQGRSLVPTTTVTVDGRGVTAELVASPAGRNPNANAVTVKLIAAADAQLGLHELRLGTPGGTSNVVRFEVGLLPEVTEAEPNHDDVTAQPLDALPVIVNGVVSRGEDCDCFRFSAAQGQTIVLDLCGQRLHPYISGLRPGWLEGVLTVREAFVVAGEDLPSIRSLASASYYASRYDPALIFTAPHDGEYVVEVRDELYRGRAEFNYRLTIGELPFVTRAFPAGARRGTRTTIQLGGANLDGATTLTAAIAPDAALGDNQWERMATPLGLSNSIAILAGDDPEWSETEPNDTPEQAETVELPATLNGVIEHEGDFDRWRFAAKKGERLIFETVSQAFGSPLDSRLDLFDARGRKLQSADDTNQLPDARIDHTFGADGDYEVRVGDTTGLGGPEYVYRLYARRPRPDFTLSVNPDNPCVTAGGSVALTVMIERLDGFNGDVEVQVPSPPVGAVISSGVINSTQNQVTLSLTMPADSEPVVVPLTVEGKATIGGHDVSRVAIPVERMRYINEWRYVPVDDLVLSVLPQAPFTLEWSQPNVTMTPGQNVHVPLTLRRTAGFTDAVRITLEGLPSRLYAPVVTIEEGATEATVEIRAAGNAPAGTGNAIASGTVRSFVQSSPALAVRVDARTESK